jgi:hypothetical protein
MRALGSINHGACVQTPCGCIGNTKNNCERHEHNFHLVSPYQTSALRFERAFGKKLRWAANLKPWVSWQSATRHFSPALASFA